MSSAGKYAFSPERQIEVYQDLAEAVLTVALEDLRNIYAKVEEVVKLDQSGGLEDWIVGEMAKKEPAVNKIDLLPIPTQGTFDLVEFFAPAGWGSALMAFCGIAEVPELLTKKVDALRRYRDRIFPLLVRRRQECLEKNQAPEGAE